MKGRFSDLKEENAIVVGTGGIGGAIVKGFLEQGCRVFAIDKSQEVLEKLCVPRESRWKSESNLEQIVADVTAQKRYKEILESIGERYKPIKVFVYTVGIGAPSFVDEFPEGFPEKLFELNVLGFIYGLKYVLPYLKKGSSATVISSINAYRPEHGMAVYDSTKAALLQYARTAAADLGKEGIRVNAVAPGYIRTPQTMEELKNPESKEMIENNTELGRIGKPEDVSSVVVALSSDDFKFVTGTCIEITGGLALAQYAPIEKQLNK